MKEPVSPLTEALFMRSARAEKLLTAAQVRRVERILSARRDAGEKGVTVAEVCLETGLLSRAVCERLSRRASLLTAAAPASSSSPASAFAARDSRRVERPASSPPPADPAGGTPAPPVFSLKDDEPAREPVAKAKIGNLPPTIGGHRIIERIGRGGMGEVYKAVQLNMERIVALKVLTPRLARDEKYISRFRREARAAGGLDHPNLVRVYDVGEDAGRHYISMEYVEGRTVKDVLKREGRFTPAEALSVVEQTAAALVCAHRASIIHRDIKPDNILLTPVGIAKLADLGLAKALSGPLRETETQTGVTMGTPRYMSPEQARADEKLDHRADLYSLGATLYHMLTGEPPFVGAGSLDILLKVLREPPPRPDRLEPLLPPPVTQLVMRLLAKNPGERPQSAVQVQREARALRRDLEDGRVFLFNDTPTVARGMPRPGPPPPLRVPWTAAALLAGAFLFLSLCVAVRSARRRAAAAEQPVPPPLLFFSNRHAAEGTSSPGPTKGLGDHKEKAAENTPPTTTPTPLPAGSSNRSFPPLPPPPAAFVLPREAKNEAAAFVAWRKALNARPEYWIALAAWAQKTPASSAIAADTGTPTARGYAELRAVVLRLQKEAWRKDTALRRAGARALAAAGLFRRAAALRRAAPALPRPPRWKDYAARANAEGRAFLARADEEARVVEKTWRRLSELRLFRLARREYERRRKELEADGAPAVQPARLEAAAAAEITAAEKKATAAEQGEREALRRAEEALLAVRRLTYGHEFRAADELCRKLLAAAGSSLEKKTLNAELVRLKEIFRLCDEVSTAVARPGNQPREKEFRRRGDEQGKLTSFSLSGFHVTRPIGRDGRMVSHRRLTELQRDELRKLLALLFDGVDKTAAHRTTRVARAALDLDDDFRRVAALKVLAREDSPAARIMVAQAERLRRASLQLKTDALLRRAEARLTAARPRECLAAAAAAWRNLGPRLPAASPLFPRIQELLNRAWEKIARRERFPSDVCEPLPRNRLRLSFSTARLLHGLTAWQWSGRPPVTGRESGKVADTGNKDARKEEEKAKLAVSPWPVRLPARLEWDVKFLPGDAGEILLSAPAVALSKGGPAAANKKDKVGERHKKTAGPAAAETWTLQLSSNGETVRIVFSKGKMTAAENLAGGPTWPCGVRLKVWLRFDGAAVSWGEGKRAYERRECRPAPDRRPTASFRGGVMFYNATLTGVPAESLTPSEVEERRRARRALKELAAKIPRSPAAPATPAALDGEGELPRILAATDEFLRRYGRFPAAASGARATMARAYRATGRPLRAWAEYVRAVFECPVEKRPPETTTLLAHWNEYLSAATTAARAAGHSASPVPPVSVVPLDKLLPADAKKGTGTFNPLDE